MKALFKGAYYIFITLLIAMGVLVVGTLVPIPGNYEIKIVQSGSMEPAIKTGAIVVVAPSDSYKVGDVITFGKDTKDQVPYTHRIVEERVQDGEVMYTTKGDANEEADVREARQSEVIGKVVLDIPYVGYVLDFARKPLGFTFLIAIPATVIVFDEMTNIWAELRKGRKRKEDAEAPSEKPSDGT